MINLTLEQIKDHLRDQGPGDEVDKLSKIILQHCLTWSVSNSAGDRVDAIVECAFGNRIDDYGNRTHGPINKRLADVVASRYAQFQCVVIAQWEIARALTNRIPPEKMISINPLYNSGLDQVSYLGTAGVLDQARDFFKDAHTIYIVAHRDHLVRCLQMAERMRYQAVSDSEKMPLDYDPHSSQAWTRNRETCLVSDMISRPAAVRQALTGAI